MSDDIRAGDVVVCVDLREAANRALRVKAVLSLGKNYRVEDTRPTKGGSGLIVRIRGIEPWWFEHWRFRKLDAAEDCFTQAMRELRPVNNGDLAEIAAIILATKSRTTGAA